MSISRILGNTAHRATEEAAMYHAVSYELAQARMADLRQRAQQETKARAARGARPPRRGHTTSRRPDLGPLGPRRKKNQTLTEAVVALI